MNAGLKIELTLSGNRLVNGPTWGKGRNWAGPLFHLQWRVVARLEELGPHDEPGAGFGIQRLDIVEDLGGALPRADHSYPVRTAMICENLGDEVCVL